MLNLKKTAVAVLALSSSAAFAGTMGPVCSAVPVTMPCESSGWEVGARALWMNIGAGDASTTLVTSSGGDLVSNVGAGFGWGFQINGAMTYGTGKNVSLDWYHINNTNDKTFGGTLLTGNASLATGSQFIRGSITSLANNGGAASVNPKLDDVNMLFGQHVDFSDVTWANLGWGWKWARVANSASQAMNGSVAFIPSSSTTATTSNYNFTANGSNTFNGFGPEVSLLGAYELVDHLDIYAKGDFSALAGFSKASVTYGDVATGGTSTTSANVVGITPVVAGKLGLNYDWDLTGFGVVGFDVNYDFREYINAFRSVRPGVSSSTGNSSSSFTAQGIVFGLDLKFVNV